jgi:hypothetical protein
LRAWGRSPLARRPPAGTSTAAGRSGASVPRWGRCACRFVAETGGTPVPP